MRMRTSLLAVALVVVVVAGGVSPAGAITDGTPDGNKHPQVGALIADHMFADGTWAYCSGTLISPTVFLTAAHCGKPGQTTARVSFSTHYRDGDTVYSGRYIADPSYGGRHSDPHDMAVVVFTKAIPNITPAKLPTANLLDRLKDDHTLATATFTPVGYGSPAPTDGPDGETYLYTDTRNQTSGSFLSLEKVWLRLSQNPSTGDGGTCHGDSGGPDFLGGPDSDLLVATTITGDSACRATNVDRRLDSASARRFLGRFVALP
ncbi:trypsin-like serine protease [Sphaerisporangium sp. NPDC051011]|uniref:trypsin-like serine protease n=1 Tax=Sphaerisporangium sp. NPDC051011 TaxID=3155792 RepID=UPI00341154C7